MFNNKQFREHIIQPALNYIGLYSPEAEELLVATMAHESKGGTYLVQTNGPALGIYQMEPATHHWIASTIIKSHEDIYDKVINTLCMFPQPTEEHMVSNLLFATQMARLRYFLTTCPLPPMTDLDGIWHCYKTYYNTSKGDATKDEFVADYLLFIGKGK